MKNLSRRAAMVVAVLTAATGLALPTTTAHAAEAYPCPRVVAVCAWTEPGGQGDLRLLWDDTPYIVPPVRSAQNQTPEPWCFYNAPGYMGDERREVARNETVADFGFDALSAKRGPCQWQ